jgi:hypothetical protein
VFSDWDLSLSTFRFAVKSLMPEVTRAAWKIDKKKLMQAQPGLTKRKFVYNLSQASYRKEWGGKYQRPGIGASIVAFLIRILPKIGPLSVLKFKPPTPETDKLFQDSFDRALEEYRGLLREQGNSQLTLANVDYDTGEATQPTEYRMADDAYAKLADKLADEPAASIDPKLREEILAYFSDLNLPYVIKRKPGEWKDTLEALEKLREQANVGQEP